MNTSTVIIAQVKLYGGYYDGHVGRLIVRVRPGELPILKQPSRHAMHIYIATRCYGDVPGPLEMMHMKVEPFKRKRKA